MSREKVIYYIAGKKRSSITTLIDQLKQKYPSHAIVNNLRDILHNQDKDVLFWEIDDKSDTYAMTSAEVEWTLKELEKDSFRRVIDINVELVKANL